MSRHACVIAILLSFGCAHSRDESGELRVYVPLPSVDRSDMARTAVVAGRRPDPALVAEPTTPAPPMLKDVSDDASQEVAFDADDGLDTDDAFDEPMRDEEFVTTASLSVRTRRGCWVSVGKQRIGRTPLRWRTVPAGPHRVVVRCKKRRLFSGRVVLQPGEHRELRVSAKKKKRTKRRRRRR